MSSLRLLALASVAALLGCGGGGGGGSSSGASIAPTSSTPGTPGRGALAFTSSASTTASVGVAWLYTAVSTNPSSKALAFSVTQGPPAITVTLLPGGSSALLAWTPASADVGPHPLTVTVSDGTSQATQSFTVVVSPASSAKGSGGTSTQKGVFTRTVATQAQAGLPSINVSYKILVPQSYVFDPQKPFALVISELTPLSSWDQIPETEGFLLVEQQGYLANGGFTYDYDPLVLQGLLADVEATWNVDTKRIYLTGFSAGAHWSYTIGLANADVFAGLGICSGSLGSAAQQGVWIPGATVQPNVPRKIFVAIRHGTTDPVVPVTEGQLARDQLKAAGFPVDYLELNQGHTVTTAELHGLWDALKPQTLP